MTTLIALKTPEHLALISDSVGVLDLGNCAVKITTRNRKLFEINGTENQTFVIQLTGELTFPTLDTERPFISTWIDENIEGEKYIKVSSLEELISKFSSDFIQKWNSVSKHSNFSPIIFWVSGRTQEGTVGTYQVVLERQKDAELSLEIAGQPSSLPFLLNGNTSFQFSSPCDAHGIIEYILFGNEQKIGQSFKVHLADDAELNEFVEKCRALAEASKEVQLEVDDLKNLGEGIVRVISEHADYVDFNSLRSAAQLPCDFAVISTRMAAQ